MITQHEWLAVHRGDLPLVVSFPHTGIDLPPEVEDQLVSPWLARKDTDYWVDVLYDFARELGATTVRTSISRTVIDMNRDPTGASLYPGLATTALCPLTTFDGDSLYKPGREPNAKEIKRREQLYFWPYHQALVDETQRLSSKRGAMVLYDAHSIRSRIPRLFEGELPQFNLGTDSGRGSTCDPSLTASVEQICDASGMSRVTNGRFRGGWITRHYGNPRSGIHAIQMELAMRGYLHEPGDGCTEANWPAPLDDGHAALLRVALRDILDVCIAFATGKAA